MMRSFVNLQYTILRQGAYSKPQYFGSQYLNGFDLSAKEYTKSLLKMLNVI